MEERPLGLCIGCLYFVVISISILIARFYHAGMDFTNIGIDDLVENLGFDKLKEILP